MLAANKLRIIIVALLIGLVGFTPTSAPAGSGWKRVIVKCAPEDLDEVKRVLGAAVVDYAHGHYLLSVNSNVDTDKVNAITGRTATKVTGEDDQDVQLRRATPKGNVSFSAPPRTLGKIINYYGAPAPQMYTEQYAVSQIDLKEALTRATGASVRVAVIDTGVDFTHKVFAAGILLPGRNYVGRTTIPSEWDDPVVTQAATNLLQLEQAATHWMELSQAATHWMELSQALTNFLELEQAAVNLIELESRAPAFGHGTMTVGLVHLVAPRAQIIPLKAFDSSGASNEWIVVRAIRDAVDMGADIINMSFAGAKNSKLIADAVHYAASKGVILVGAAGNDNWETPLYPASYEDVVAVTAVTAKDTKASFANYGNYVDLSAPGENLITTFPKGFASVDGTSESAPIVAGVFALAKDNGTRTSKLRDKVERAVDDVKDIGIYRNKLGSGRINAGKAVSNGNNENNQNNQN